MATKYAGRDSFAGSATRAAPYAAGGGDETPDPRRPTSMRVPSTRFTVLEVDESAVLTFPDGLIGLPGTTYTLIVHEQGSPFHWLHSLEDPGVAVPVTSPWLFFGDYEVRLTDDQAAGMGLLRPVRPR